MGKNKRARLPIGIYLLDLIQDVAVELFYLCDVIIDRSRPNRPLVS